MSGSRSLFGCSIGVENRCHRRILIPSNDWKVLGVPNGVLLLLCRDRWGHNGEQGHLGVVSGHWDSLSKRTVATVTFFRTYGVLRLWGPLVLAFRSLLSGSLKGGETIEPGPCASIKDVGGKGLVLMGFALVSDSLQGS